MDVQRNNRERLFSILNDNDSPSFVIRRHSQPAIKNNPTTSPRLTKLPSISACLSPRSERPSLLRREEFHRNPSVSSAGSPPLLRYDSSSSTKSSSSRSMDSTPSPITPAYNYNDNTVVSYDSLLRQDMANGYLPSPSTITPFMEQQLMIAPAPLDVFGHKNVALLPQSAAYPIIPAPQPELAQLPTPTMSANASVSSASSANPASKTSPAAATPGKKNKYPCPYAQSHNCSATFTTSGHAARHGKKHTGEKGVHCPVCDKAFTRKDNMKQHERTHKNQPSSSEDRRSKAAITREAQKSKSTETAESEQPTHLRKLSSGTSDPSDITLPPTMVDTPGNQDPTFFPDANPQILMPSDATLPMTTSMAQSIYPPLADDALLNGIGPLPGDKIDGTLPPPPALIRGFSDLDTLAQAAESFDPYFQNQF